MQLKETTKFAVSPPFSQLLMPFLPQMSRSYVVFGKVRTLPFTTYIFVKSLEKLVKLFVPRQQPIQLPLLPGSLVLRHFRGAAHHGFDEIVLVLVGETGQPVHLVQHHTFQKFQPDIVCLGTFPQAGIMALTAKKFDVVVALVEVEIEIAAALRAFQIAGKRAGFLGNSRPPPAGPFLHALHLFPGRPVNDSLVDIEEDCPVFLRV